MRSFARIAPFAISFLALTGAANAATHRAPVCPRLGSHMIEADSQAEVYLAPESREFPEFLGLYGCAWKSGHRYLLGQELGKAESSAGTAGVTLETLSGAIVAYEAISADPSHADWTVVVRSLRTGKTLHRVPTGTPAHPTPTEVGVGPVMALVLKSDGAVAWIAEAEPGFVYQVRSVDSSGDTLLASGPDISSTSLALTASTLYWTQSGKPVSARLN